MPTVIVPVGLSLGPSYRYADPPDPEPEFWEVRLGTESEELTAEEFKVWGTAFLDPPRHSRLEVNRKSLRRDLIAGGQGPTNPDPIITRLIERGFLLEYDTEGPLEEPFRKIKLFPLADGMGNKPENVDRWLIGHNAKALVEVSSLVHGLWAFSSTIGSLWDACVAIAGINAEANRSEEYQEELSAAFVARQGAEAVPMLISCGCAFIDPVG